MTMTKERKKERKGKKTRNFKSFGGMPFTWLVGTYADVKYRGTP